MFTKLEDLAVYKIVLIAMVMAVITVQAQNIKPGKKHSVILGVYVGNEAANVKAFENWLGRAVPAVLGYTGGGEKGDWNAPDPGWQIDMNAYLGGAGRQILWSIPMAPDDGGAAAYREIAAGQHNALYESWAEKILNSRVSDNDPIYVRTTWELGGEWFPWTQAAKDDPRAYRNAFVQFARSFHKVSSRFKLVWDFAADRGPVEQWYPGDQAVDVLSQDVYWNPEYSGVNAEKGFQWARSRSRGLDWMVKFAGKHNKPMALSEWGAPGSNTGELDAARFIQMVSAWIASHNLVYATYWDAPEASAYDGKLSDGKPEKAAAELKKFYLSGPDNGIDSCQ